MRNLLEVRVFEGDCDRGAPHGKGKIQCADGTVYEGDHVDGELHGRGAMTCPGGKVFKGIAVQKLTEKTKPSISLSISRHKKSPLGQ